MKIAVHVDAEDRIVDVHRKGRLRLFDDASGVWRAERDIPFEIVANVGIGALKRRLRLSLDGLDDCRTFVSGENRGLVMTILQEEFGFRVWKASGPLADLDLADVARRDEELAAVRRQEEKDRAFAAQFAGSANCDCGEDGLAPPRKVTEEAIEAAYSLTEALGEGRLRIDLTAIMARYRNANSLAVLDPLLEARRFESLEIVCEHLPRWLPPKLAALNLKAEVSDEARGVRALVSPIG